jgi:hypothetical protein
MKFSQYVANLNKFLKDFPQSADMEAITSADDEGNGFNAVHYTPSMGTFEDHEFTQQDTANAVCVN